MSTLEDSLRSAIASALLKDKSVGYIIARELVKNQDFIDKMFNLLVPETIAKEVVRQMVITDKTQRRYQHGTINLSSIIREAENLAAGAIAEKMSAEVENV